MLEIVYVIEFPSEDGEQPEVWADRQKAGARFEALYKEYGNKREGLRNDYWDSENYMSFDDDRSGFFTVEAITIRR